ncbi:F207A protein, partial [Amia calva]|nr:F207A protein [Amia calva]
MVGKIKRVRQKLHQEAVRLQYDRGERSGLPEKEETPGAGSLFLLSKPEFKVSQQHTPDDVNVSNAEKPRKGNGEEEVKQWNVFSSTVFAKTKITPEALVQTLKLDDAWNAVSVQKGAEEKKQVPKKDKMKQRRERWLNKIRSIKLDKEEQKAQAKRKATPVVGDMQPLADALPELSDLVTASKATARRKSRVPVKKKPGPTDFSQMKPAQKRKVLEEETAHFSEAIQNTVFKANPLACIGEHLRKRLKQEEEESPS